MRVPGSGVAVFLLLGLVSWSRGQETIKTISGSNVTFKADVTAGPSEIAWFQGTNKIVDLEVGTEPYFYRLKERTVPNLQEGTLLLQKVSPADSGPYRAQLLIGSSYSNIYFNLQVFDHVCKVVIQNSTRENNVTLTCTCSAPSTAPPATYQWYNVSSGRHVSDLQDITVQKEDKEQLLRCNASNDVSWTNATITVPTKDNVGRSHIIIIIVVIAVILLLPIIIYFIFYMWRKKKRSKFSVQNEEDTVKLLPKILPKPAGESLTPSGIYFKKDEEILMSIKLQSPVLSVERLSVQQDMLRIMDVKEEDYAQYKAEVHLREQTTTRTFLCTSAQNGEVGQHDDAETELVYPQNGELRMKIPDVEKAERVVWSKDGAEILEMTCRPPASEGLVLYRGALSTGLVSDRDETRWEDVARPDGTSVQYTFSLSEAALNSGSVTLYPVIVEKEEEITWKKDGQKLVTWRAGEAPEYSRDSLHLESGRLTLRNLNEDCSGQYIMEARGPKTAQQEFSLTIQRATGS